MCHRPLFISVISLLLLFIAMHQEDRVIQRNTKLQYCCQRLCNIRNLSQKIVASQIIENRHPDTEQKQHRHEE